MSAARRLSEVLEHIARIELAPGQSADKRHALDALRGEADRLAALAKQEDGTEALLERACERWALMHYMSDMPEDGTFLMFIEAATLHGDASGLPAGWTAWEPFEYWNAFALVEAMEGSASSLRYMVRDMIAEIKKEEA